MATRTFAFRLPVAGSPRATFETDFGLRGGRLLVEDRVAIAVHTREALANGAVTRYADQELEVRLVTDGATEHVVLLYAGQLVPTEDRLSAPPSRSAWIHGWVALAASFFGFVASWLYLERARSFEDAWALKMAIHTAGWHLMLTLLLFPASVWGQRIGIRAVQLVSLIFFFIHLGMAISNLDAASRSMSGPWIATFNALSGICFAAAVVYGQTAHRDMDPLRANGKAKAAGEPPTSSSEAAPV